MPMDNARAQEINGALCSYEFYGVGISEKVPGGLEGVSLEEMIEATRIVRKIENPPDKEGMRLMTSTCDDRLIAAIYVALNWDYQSENHHPIVLTPESALVHVRRQVHDEN